MKHVLLVEDDDAVAELVGLILHESGYVVERVSTVADALVSVRSVAPAAVLLDLSLPGRSGLSFLKECRSSAALADVPIALMSGTSLPDLEGDLAPDAVLGKPFDIDYLCAVIDGLTRDANPSVGDAVPQA